MYKHLRLLNQEGFIRDVYWVGVGLVSNLNCAEDGYGGSGGSNQQGKLPNG